MIICQTSNFGFHLKFTLCTVDFKLCERFPVFFLESTSSFSLKKSVSNQRNSNSPEEMPGARMTRQFFEEKSLIELSNKLVPYVGFDKKPVKKPLLLDGSTYQLRDDSSFLHHLNGRKLRVPKAGKGNTRRLKSTIHFK